MAKILVAEDELAVREFVARALRHRGHQVTAVEDGQSALEQAFEGDYDLLITDVIMPGLDGLSLAIKVAERCPKLRVLVMTGFAEQEQRAQVEGECVQAVISKPFTLQQICSAADDALAVA